MNDDEVMELAQRAGTYTEVEDGEEWLVMSESAFPVFAKLIIEAEREKCDGGGIDPGRCEMNQYDVLKMAREAGLLRGGDGWTMPHRWGITEIERFAALVAEPLQARIKELYRQLGEAEKQLDQQYKLGAEAKLDECILMLERLYERSGEQYKQYLHAARVLKGEV